MSRRLPFLALLILATAAPAATPPALLHYQGVLRDAGNHPLDGSHDMVFTFFDSATVGVEILSDSHTAASGGAVVVSGGLFDVELGSGAVTDGPGAGTYTSLADVFADYGEIWMRITVGGETLAPRVRVVAAAYALNASHLQGREAAAFLDTSTTGQSKAGPLTLSSTAAATYGLTAGGPEGGGVLRDSDGTGVCYGGYGNTGVIGEGTSLGGQFENTATGSLARLGMATYGIDARGTEAGGLFVDSDGSGYAYVGHGDDGIYAEGNTQGGFFRDSDSLATARAGYGTTGIQAYGSSRGGYFYDTDGTGALSAGYGDYGVMAEGSYAGAYFHDTDATSYAWAAYSGYGILAQGTTMGGSFEDLDSTTNARAAYGSYTIYGNGTKSFVQNHPTDPTRLLAYVALEGDEAGTYTRGTGRLVEGEARIALGETFRWVTNPDVGLTAQVTARDAGAALYVASLTTEELVVRASEGSVRDARFDFQVNGLRLGFEDLPIARARSMDAPLPLRGEDRAELEKDPALRDQTALGRFTRMRELAGERGALDLSHSQALVAAIGTGVPRPREEARPDPASPASASVLPSNAPAEAAGFRDPDGNVYGRSFRSVATDLASLLPVSGPVESGDVLALDPERPGMMRLAQSATDRGVVGVVAAEAGVVLGQEGPETGAALAPVATSGVVLCKADAGYGSIRAGDLLTTSPTPGHAMRVDDPGPGSVLGKALEPLDQGTGRIRVLVLMR